MVGKQTIAMQTCRYRQANRQASIIDTGRQANRQEGRLLSCTWPHTHDVAMTELMPSALCNYVRLFATADLLF